MNLSAVTTCLIALCPAISAVVTAVIGFLGLAKTINSMRKENDNTVGRTAQRIERMEKKVNTLITKISSIEAWLVEQKEKIK